MRVLIQLRSTPQLRASLATGEAVPPSATEAAALVSTGLVLDAGFEPVELPGVQLDDGDGRTLAFSAPIEFSSKPEDATHLVRGTIPDDDSKDAVISEAFANPAVVGVFSDPVIERCLTCIGDPAVGNSGTVGRLLEVSKLKNAGMTGQGVSLAIVDTGIAAPNATFLDHAVLLSTRQGPTVMAGLLSDAVRSYARLRNVMNGMPAARRALVVSNSWGMFDPRWDFPVGHPGNYSDNPRHPFNVIVASLEAAGADILFAAGNCGVQCPDGRCNFRRKPVCGANSHGRVLSVAGIDTRRKRVGYSSQGPGRLAPQKPDLAAYTHFKGSEVFAPDPDGGTSAACPVLAGVVAAVRTKYSATRLPPAGLRALLFKTARDLGGVGFDYDHGWGTVDSTALIAALKNVPRRR